MGSRGMPRRYYDYLPQFQPFHQLSTIGSWILGVGLLPAPRSRSLESLWKRQEGAAQPVGLCRLEWRTPTPPPLANFDETPVFTRGPYDYHLATAEELSTDGAGGGEH